MNEYHASTYSSEIDMQYLFASLEIIKFEYWLIWKDKFPSSWLVNPIWSIFNIIWKILFTLNSDFHHILTKTNKKYTKHFFFAKKLSNKNQNIMNTKITKQPFPMTNKLKTWVQKYK